MSSRDPDKPQEEEPGNTRPLTPEAFDGTIDLKAKPPSNRDVAVEVPHVPAPAPSLPRSGRGGYVPVFEAGDLVASRYEVVRFVARGGMGEVYEVKDRELGGRVALKVIRGEMAADDAAVGRFKREIALARRVSHPNVCRIFDLGRHTLEPAAPGAPASEVLFLTMELLEGQTLTERIRGQGRFSGGEALPIARQMAAGLATAHDAGIIHRDFKSSNVILIPTRQGERVVITDFGLARGTIDAKSMASMTGVGDILGTPAYMAPEQLQSGKVGPAADIYALGVVLYEMLTGELPFGGDSPISIALKRLTVPPEPPRNYVADIDPAWEAVILRCLARDPAERFESANDVVLSFPLSASQSLIAPAAPPAPADASRPAHVPVSRRKGVALGLGAAALAILLMGGLWNWRNRSPAPSESQAPSAADAANPAGPVKVRRAIAVLGFKNLGKPDADWLSTAISEMLRTELGTGGELRMIAGENIARMKLELAVADTDSLAADTLSKIHTNLTTDYVVLGSYLVLGKGQLRIDVRLQDVAQGETVTSSRAEGTEEKLFAVVSEAGSKLREALALGTVSSIDAGAARAAFPSNPAAAEFYSQGLSRLRLFDAADAKIYLEKAVGSEPGHPLIHAALASAWFALGYDPKARSESKIAFDLSENLPREERLGVHARHYETTAEWAKAVETHKALLLFFPDKLDYALRLTAAQTSAGQGKEALESVAAMRRLPLPISEDPRIDLAEADAAKMLTDFPRQEKAATTAAVRAQAMNARLIYAHARLSAGSALVNMGQLEKARKACEEAITVFAAAGDRGSVARTENIIAVSYARAGDIKSARTRFEQALEEFRKIGDQRGIALQLNNVGNAALMLGDPIAARRLYLEVLEISRAIGDRSGVGRALNNIANVSEKAGDLEGALRTYEEALTVYKDLGAQRSVALVTANIGEIYYKQKRLDTAREKYEASLKISRGIDAKGDAAGTLTLLARLLLGRGDLDGAEKALREAIPLFRAEEDPEGEIGSLRDLATVLGRRGDQAGAKAATDQAVALEKKAKK